jgi:anthranilate/para-aminobenzoate synthase component I
MNVLRNQSRFFCRLQEDYQNKNHAVSLTDILTAVLLISRLLSIAAAVCLPYSGGPLTEILQAGLPDTKYTQNVPYLTAESRNGDSQRANMSRTFKIYCSNTTELFYRDMRYFDLFFVFQFI